jgi:hypothetical protein
MWYLALKIGGYEDGILFETMMINESWAFGVSYC